MEPHALSASAEVFSAMKSTWGVQAFGQMFAGMSDDEWEQTPGIWDRALAGFDRSLIRLVLSDFVRRGDPFPPKLPQLAAACNAKSAAAKQEVQRLEQPRTNREQISKNLQAIHAEFSKLAEEQKSRHPMFWAHQPKSAAAVQLLVSGAQSGDDRLLLILREHERQHGKGCRSRDAEQALCRFFGSPPEWYQKSMRRAA